MQFILQSERAIESSTMAHPRPQHQDKHSNSPSPATSIPPLQIGPAIFVPITEDLTKPPPHHATASARLAASLAAYDTHTAGVQANLLAMLTREKARICQAGAEMEASQIAAGDTPAVSRPGLQEELALMIEFMKAPHDPNVNYDQKDAIPMLNLWEGPPPRSQREWTAREVMGWSHQAAVEMGGHKDHCKDHRRRYEVALQKALEEEAE